MAVIDIEEVKVLLQLTGSTRDNEIYVLIPIIDNYIKTSCNNTFDVGFPEGLKLVAVEMIDYILNKPTNNLTAETVGGISKTYNLQFPQSIVDGLTPYKSVRFI